MKRVSLIFLLCCGFLSSAIAQPTFSNYFIAGPAGANPGTYSTAGATSKINNFGGIERSTASNGGYNFGSWVGNLSNSQSWYNPDGSGVGGALNFIGQYSHQLAFSENLIQGQSLANAMATLGSTSDPSVTGSVISSVYSRIVVTQANVFSFRYSGDAASGFQSSGNRRIFIQKNDTTLFDSLNGTGAISGEITGSVVAGDKLSFNLTTNGSATTWNSFQFANTTTLSQGYGTASGELRLGPVPEPATMTALGLGLIALLRRRNR